MTITILDKPNTKKQVEKVLNPLVKKWFYSRFKEFSLPQLYGVVPIQSRENILVSAPTGATKTLTAFLAILNELVDNAQKGILKDKICSPGGTTIEAVISLEKGGFRTTVIEAVKACTKKSRDMSGE